MEFEQVVRGRRSIRKYQDREVSTDLILKAIELATWAPNNGGFQAWKFYVVKSREVIDKICDAVQAKVDLMASWPEADEVRETIDRHQAKCAFFRPAPVLIVVGMGGYQGPADKVLAKRDSSDPDAQQMIADRKATASRAQTVAAATMLLELAIHSLGLGSCWLAGPMLARKEIAELVGAPDDVQLFCVVSVGYPAEEKVAAPRKPLEEVVKFI